MGRTAILLVNLGSPESPTTKDLKPYLEEFLMDERVIDLPKWLRTLIVKGLIVPFRSPKSAAKYKTVWTEEGSPLIIHTRNQRELLQQRTEIPIYFSMRYGSPSSEIVLKNIHHENPDLQQIVLLPLYPHYAMSSYETAVEQVKQLHEASKFKTTLKIVKPFYNRPSYIKALSESIKPYLAQPFDHLLFSYHGIPERHVKKTDCTGSHCLQNERCCSTPSPAHDFCYRHQVISTSDLVATELGLKKTDYSFSFQSRLGRDAWLKPFTVNQLKEFPSKGIKNLLIVCPAFVSDCLETLEEIEMEGKEDFLNSGGEDLRMIPAMNENPEWIACMAKLIEEQLLPLAHHS